MCLAAHHPIMRADYKYGIRSWCMCSLMVCVHCRHIALRLCSHIVFSANGHLIGVADEWVASALAGLPERERSIVLLAYWAGWSDRMIAEDMGCPRSTVQFRRARALAALRDALGGEGDA